MKVMHEGRLDGVSAASNPQEGERGAHTCTADSITGN